jgi:hypothetical protein
MVKAFEERSIVSVDAAVRESRGRGALQFNVEAHPKSRSPAKSAFLAGSAMRPNHPSIKPSTASTTHSFLIIPYNDSGQRWGNKIGAGDCFDRSNFDGTTIPCEDSGAEHCLGYEVS